MNQGKFIFPQLTEFLLRRIFHRIASERNGNNYVRKFTCWNQMLCMVFGQFTARGSIRDFMLSLEVLRTQFYHLGFGTTVTWSNFGKANAKRDCEIFEEFAYWLMSEAQKTR